jgi:tol-pal system protein YbgF
VKIILKDNLKYKISIYCLLFSVYCLLSACATTQDVNLVSQDVNRIHRDYLTVKTEIDKLKEKTVGIVREDSFNALRQSQAEIQSSLTNLGRDVHTISGRFEENKYFIEKTLKNSVQEIDLIKLQITTLESQIKEIKEKLNVLEAQVVHQQKESLKEKSKEDEKKYVKTEKDIPKQEEQPVKPSVPDDKKAKYDEAYNTFQNKKYKEARDKFEGFIKEYPEDTLTDNAYFWIAETYYGENDFEGAILAYETFLKKFPKSAKVPAALLKQGLAFVEIGDKKIGKLILEQVIEKYSDSREAELAKKNVEKLKQNSKKK